MNVETWLPLIDEKTCTGCGDCVEVCPTEALAMQGRVAVISAPDACNYCAFCEGICPVEAIALPYQIVWEESD